MAMLALTDDVILPLSTVNELKLEGSMTDNALIITMASTQSTLPLDPSSMDTVIGVSKEHDFPTASLLAEIYRVLKADGNVIIHLTGLAVDLPSDNILSSLNRKILVAGFLEPEASLQQPDTFSGVQSIQVKARKPSWNIGSSFSLKASKGLPKVQINDDMDLIDEDSLLTKDDLKKPQLPPVGDCEVGSTRKACKNCTCGRAEEEQKVENLGLTMDQLDNPQSACGSCGLGDAFRCSTCPYKGLPAFKLGEKHEFMMHMLL
ncbi:anamorsin homolog [Chenopodium quinoa]|uniref:anamorsin homolog n=1 Tax=Chenopodium quinoa TaxID=63459 RepID=UPI000B77D1FC|nr:anamorsin homolog [Chenopodium quinoa]XP_021742564.1 anamorsin homolog [Chenopodium quinoa]